MCFRRFSEMQSAQYIFLSRTCGAMIRERIIKPIASTCCVAFASCFCWLHPCFSNVVCCSRVSASASVCRLFCLLCFYFRVCFCCSLACVSIFVPAAAFGFAFSLASAFVVSFEIAFKLHSERPSGKSRHVHSKDRGRPCLAMAGPRADPPPQSVYC